MRIVKWCKCKMWGRIFHGVSLLHSSCFRTKEIILYSVSPKLAMSSLKDSEHESELILKLYQKCMPHWIRPVESALKCFSGGILFLRSYPRITYNPLTSVWHPYDKCWMLLEDHQLLQVVKYLIFSMMDQYSRLPYWPCQMPQENEKENSIAFCMTDPFHFLIDS